MCVRGHCSSIHRPVVSNVDIAFSEGRLNMSLINSRWCYPAVQHLTARAEGGGKGYSI